MHVVGLGTRLQLHPHVWVRNVRCYHDALHLTHTWHKCGLGEEGVERGVEFFVKFLRRQGYACVCYQDGRRLERFAAHHGLLNVPRELLAVSVENALCTFGVQDFRVCAESSKFF